MVAPLRSRPHQRVGGTGLLNIDTSPEFEEQENRRIFKLQIDKLHLLFKHYKIDEKGQHKWQQLSFYLACEYVPRAIWSTRQRSRVIQYRRPHAQPAV
jgi:hypothetical protein